jgi:hypothetical protein
VDTRSGLSQRADRKSNIIGIREQRGDLTERYRSVDERRAEGKRLRAKSRARLTAAGKRLVTGAIQSIC